MRRTSGAYVDLIGTGALIDLIILLIPSFAPTCAPAYGSCCTISELPRRRSSSGRPARIYSRCSIPSRGGMQGPPPSTCCPGGARPRADLSSSTAAAVPLRPLTRSGGDRDRYLLRRPTCCPAALVLGPTCHHLETVVFGGPVTA
jgi:hypothetical protein